MSCKSSNDITVRCPDPTTTHCVSYQGIDFDCLEICTGEAITYTLEALAQATCDLITATTLTGIVIPTCLTASWGITDKTIFNFTQFLLDRDCYIDSQIGTINTTLQNFDPQVSVDYKCCSDNPCVTTGTVALSVSLQNIVNCLCDLKSFIGDTSTALPDGQTLVELVLGLNSTVEAQAVTIVSLQNQITALSNTNISLQTQINTANTNISTLQDKVDCIIAAGGFSC